MSLLDRTFVIILVSVIAMAAVAMAFVPAEPLLGLAALPIFLFAEIFLFLVLLLVMNPRATIGMAFGGAVVFVMLRALCSLVGGMLVSLSSTIPLEDALLVWMNPIPAIVQVLLLAVAGPYILAAAVPELVGRQEAERILGDPAAAARQASPPPSAATVGPESTPTGGFIQVFSYEELGAIMRKTPGLEGFMVVSSEGLIVWRDLPLRIDVDRLAAHSTQHSQDLADLMLDVGLSRVRRVLVEARDHIFFQTALNGNFSLILIFSGQVPTQDIFARIPIMAKSTREFLQWRYPRLHVRPSGQMEQPVAPMTFETA